VGPESLSQARQRSQAPDPKGVPDSPQPAIPEPVKRGRDSCMYGWDRRRPTGSAGTGYGSNRDAGRAEAGTGYGSNRDAGRAEAGFMPMQSRADALTGPGMGSRASRPPATQPVVAVSGTRPHAQDGLQVLPPLKSARVPDASAQRSACPSLGGVAAQRICARHPAIVPAPRYRGNVTDSPRLSLRRAQRADIVSIARLRGNVSNPMRSTSAWPSLNPNMPKRSNGPPVLTNQAEERIRELPKRGAAQREAPGPRREERSSQVRMRPLRILRWWWRSSSSSGGSVDLFAR
jgi:hypothetical protein